MRFARRSDLDLEAGTFTVHGDGKKEGTVIRLNSIQRLAIDKCLGGYLRILESTAADYHLFPGGRLRMAVAHRDSGPCSRMVIGKWFRLAEKLAGITHKKGRCAYGLRRMAVDKSRERGVSDEALKIQGGWKEIMTPNSIYADQQPAWAMNEAAEALEHIRRGTGGEDTRPQS